MPSISPLFGSLSLSYIYKDLKIQSVFKFSDSKDPNEYSLAGEDGLEESPFIINQDGIKSFLGAPKWSDLSIYASKKVSSNSTLRLGISNIFDIHYRTFASGISAPGRSIQAGLNLKL